MSLQRSCLYSIEPIAIGSFEIESLSSYLSRLADVHCVTVGDIISHLIAPDIHKKYIKSIAFNGGNGFYKSSSAINGHGNIAEDFIEIIESLTKRKDIRKTTLLNCRELVPFRGLQKNSRFWCPSCFQADLDSKQIVYERLSWTLQPFHKCVIHDRVLESVCPFCKSCMYTLERRSAPGYCTRCFYWLGNYTEDKSANIHSSKSNELMRIFFEELVNLSFENDCVSRSISFYIEKNFGGSLTKAAEFLGYSKSTLWGWKEGANLAPLKALIEITLRLQLNLSSFINMEKLEIEITDSYSIEFLPSERSKKDHNLIQNFLNEILAEKRPYSLTAIAKLMDCDRKLLNQFYPNECRQIKKIYLDDLETKKQNKTKVIKQNIDKAVYILRKRGKYPTRGEIEKIVGKSVLREKRYWQYWKDNSITDLLMDNYGETIDLIESEEGRTCKKN